MADVAFSILINLRKVVKPKKLEFTKLKCAAGTVAHQSGRVAVCSGLGTVFQPHNYSAELSLASLFCKKKRHYLKRSVAEER